MPENSVTLITNNVYDGSNPIDSIVGEKYQGDGYYGSTDGFHTVQYNISEFVGRIRIQASLATVPEEADWFTLAETTHVAVVDDSTDISSGGFVYNFTGNYVFVRAWVTDWTDGTVLSVLLNH